MQEKQNQLMKLKNIFIKKSSKKKIIQADNTQKKLSTDFSLINFDLHFLRNFVKKQVFSQNLKLYNSSKVYVQDICEIMNKYFQTQSVTFLIQRPNEIEIKVLDTNNLQQQNIVLEEKEQQDILKYLESSHQKNELISLNQEKFQYLKPTLNLDNTLFYQIQNVMSSQTQIQKAYAFIQFKDFSKNQSELQNTQFYSFYSLIDTFVGLMFGYMYFDMFLFKNIKYYSFDFMQQFLSQIIKRFQSQHIQFDQFTTNQQNIKPQNQSLFFKENQLKNNNSLNDKANSKKILNQMDSKTIKKFIISIQQKLEKWKIYDQIKHASVIVLNKNKNIEYINTMPLKIQKSQIEQKIKQKKQIELVEILQLENLVQEIEQTLEQMIQNKTLYFQNNKTGFSIELIVNRCVGKIENYVIQIPFQTLKQCSQKNLVQTQQKLANIQLAKTTLENKVVRNQKRRQVNFNQQFQPQIRVDINPSYRIKSGKQNLNLKTESVQLFDKSIEKIHNIDKKQRKNKAPIQSFSIISQQSIISNMNDFGDDTQSKFESLNLDFQKLEYQRSIVMEFLPKMDSTLIDIKDFNSQSQILRSMQANNKFDKKRQRDVLDNYEFLQQKIKENQYIMDDWNLDVNNKDQNFIIGLLLEIFDPYIKHFNIDSRTFCKFLISIQETYEKNNNPFHNFYHGVSVCYAAQYFVKHSQFIKQNLSELKIFGFLLAALSHDLGHTGFNNNYEINSKSQIALTYLDQSPLEHHHCSQFFKLVSKKEIDIFSTLETQQYQELKRFIIDLIISTDMQKHFDLLNIIQKVNQNDTNEQQILHVMKYLLHSCDLAHTTKPKEIAEKLSKLINQEFINQYRCEQKNKLPLTQHFENLDNPKVFYESETNFIRAIVKPLFTETQKILNCKENNFEFLLRQIDENLEYYSQKLEYFSSTN